MAFLKGELSGARAPYGSSLLGPPRGLDGQPISFAPSEAAKQQAMREAQRKALANYMAKVTSPESAELSMRTGGMDEEKRRGYQRQKAIMPPTGEVPDANSVGPLGIGDLDAMFGGMTDEEIRAQASEMFKPQFDYLSGLEDAAKGRHKVSDQAVAQIYAALQQGYKNDAPVVADIYGDAGAAMKGAYTEGVENIAEAQDETAARTAAVMKKLGIEQAGAGLFKDNVADAQAAQQRLRSQQAVDLSGNASSQGAALQDLTVKGQAAGLEGADQRTMLQMQLADILAGYGMKRADLSTKQAEAAMQIQSNEAAQQQDYLKMLMEEEQNKFNNELKLGQYDLDRDKFDWEKSQDSLAGPDTSKLSPLEQFYAAGAQAYSNPVSANNGIKAVTDAARLFQAANKRPPQSAQDLINYIRERAVTANNGQTPNDIRILMDLAQRYWDAVN